jgi:Phosphotransferase enzyme family
VRLALVDDRGEPLGVLGPLHAPTPWWPDVEPVVGAVRARWGLDVTVLRLLSEWSGPTPLGGQVTYLAEVGRPLVAPPELRGLDPRSHWLAAALADEPLRAPWAQLGGPAAIVAWADDVLAARGTPRTGAAEQVKTWNLSSILRLPTSAGPAWCKSVPAFLGHEGGVIDLVARTHPGLVPTLLGAHPPTGTVLMADVPGEDQWVAPTERLLEMVRVVIDVQDGLAPQVDELLALGLPDWRGPALVAAVSTLAARPDVRADLASAELDELDLLVERLPEQVAELASCGLPDTLVHGDLHPGNWRHGPGGLLLLDWGDSGVGHPLLDTSSFLERVGEPARAAVRAAWAAGWRERRPGADPARALTLVEPLAALRRALVYQGFLDRIEPDERVYHRADVAQWLRAALVDAAA